MLEILERLKQWGQNFLNKSDTQTNYQGSLMELEDNLNRRTDPRELPRPIRREGSSRLLAVQSKFQGNKPLGPEENEIGCCTVTQNTSHLEASGCLCTNCSELTDTFANCIVCMEPLQGAKIFSCTHCGNITCWTCAKRVHNCPFCRADELSDFRNRNIALERLLANLALPCRNARWGCSELMKYNSRDAHELVCRYSPMGCPWHRICGWNGDTKDLTRHLKEEHMLAILPGNGITIEISQFRAKIFLSDHKPRKYTVSLASYASIFVCKILMYKRKLGMTFARVSEEHQDLKFGAWLEVRSFFRTLKGIVPISSNCARVKALDVSCESLVSPWKKSDDQVVINITIRPMT